MAKNFIKNLFVNNNKKKTANIFFSKRQKFIAGVLFLSFCFFIASYLLNGYGVIAAFSLSFLTDLFLLWGIYPELKNNFYSQVFILASLYSLSFGLFSFLTPSRLLSKIILTIIYAIGTYSLFLCENIFLVAINRTIALLNSARIISLVVSLVVAFFITSAIFSAHVSFLVEIPLIFIIYFLISNHGIWTYTLEKDLKKDLFWVLNIAFFITELSIIIWFWPSSPVVIALFLTGMWYFFIGLSYIWLDRRLFKNVFWEHFWIVFISILLFTIYTKWGA